jgi:hypothetical protein
MWVLPSPQYLGTTERCLARAVVEGGAPGQKAVTQKSHPGIPALLPSEGHYPRFEIPLGATCYLSEEPG